MSMTDTISDMLARIRNAQKVKLMQVVMPASRIRESILRVLCEEGYVLAYETIENPSFQLVGVSLKYTKEGRGVISEIHRVSRPGKRIYSSICSLSGYYNHMGIYILSTSRGVISDRTARVLGVGGEVLCKVF